MTEVGIYAGNVEYSGAETETVMVDCQLVPIPALSSFSGPVSTSTPLGLVVTEFHALLAYNNRVCGICLLNEQVHRKLLTNVNVCYCEVPRLKLVCNLQDKSLFCDKMSLRELG